jgi:hypothetical protein
MQLPEKYKKNFDVSKLGLALPALAQAVQDIYWVSRKNWTLFDFM